MKASPILRLIVIAGIIAGLLIPIAMIEFVVIERTGRRTEAVGEIASMWADPQIVSGPVLTLPYRCEPAKGAAPDPCYGEASVKARTIAIEGSVEPEIRRRSLFEAIVYVARLKVTATFVPGLSPVLPPPQEFLWDRATINVAIADPRGIEKSVDLVSGGQRSSFVPGTSSGTAGMRARLREIRPAADGTLTVSYEFGLRGTREIGFIALGEASSVKLRSGWPHPSFVGAALPSTRTIDSGGFSVEWISGAFSFARPSTGSGESASQTAGYSSAQTPASFGVALITPVDVYQQTERALKYAILFVVATFMVAFLWEVTRGTSAHPVQYIFVGFAISIFYLLLLSISEHWSFDGAYVVASSATVGLLAWYWRWIAGTRAQGGLMAVILSVMYGFLYLLLRLEDYALLAGSAALFVGLAVVMFLTRRIDWNNPTRPPIAQPPITQ